MLTLRACCTNDGRMAAAVNDQSHQSLKRGGLVGVVKAKGCSGIFTLSAIAAARITGVTEVDTELRLTLTPRRKLNAETEVEADVETEADCVAAAASMLTRDLVCG